MMTDHQAPPGLSVDEERAAVAGAVFARTQGLVTTVDDMRYRMRKARVGARILDVYSAAGEQLGTLTEVVDEWVAMYANGAGAGTAATFAAAVDAVTGADVLVAALTGKPNDEVLRKTGVDMVRAAGEIGITPAEVAQNLVEAFPEVRVPRVYRILGDAKAAGELVQPRGSGHELYLPDVAPVDQADVLDAFARLGDVGPVVLDVVVAAVDARGLFLAGAETLSRILDDARPPVRQAFADAIEAARGAAGKAERVIAAYAPAHAPLADTIAAVEAQRGRGV
jgi:hypothetical protein